MVTLRLVLVPVLEQQKARHFVGSSGSARNERIKKKKEAAPDTVCQGPDLSTLRISQVSEE